MFQLFKKKTNSSAVPFPFSKLEVDMHSHIIPGVDDGSADMETSLELIRGMAELGYRKLIATPHIMWDMYRNTPELLRERLTLVQEAVKKEGLPVEIFVAAEYYLDEHVEELLRNKEPLLTISGNKVLTEFSMAFPSLNIRELLFNLQMEGYQPVIAHPERYVYLNHNKGFYDELRDAGCLFQLNLLSVTGYYGRSVLELAQYLLKKGYYDIIGTDLHHEGHLARLRSLQADSSLQDLMDSGKLLNSSL
jgi:tyrosine-protein phosphatase YwqE